MAAPSAISELIERFENHRPTYRSTEYNEAQLREEFINPFFAALGWDVYNRKGYADAYKEVIHEAAIKVGGRTKAPDYCFRAGGGRPSFYVEAKKPAVDISEAANAAYQLRRYAWSAKLPVSILTDFAGLAVYDGRVRPIKTDKVAVARVLYFSYHEYLDRWDELNALLSPEAVRRGALDRFVTSQRTKKGTAEVDAAFLAEIETWRVALARNFALRNDIEQRDLNFAVQKTIDRIVFLRICEDRGIEPYGNLQSLCNGAAVYRRLGELFQRADERYNSGLFHFSPEKDRDEPPDEFTLGLAVDDRPIKDIIESIYYPESSYEFSVLPAEILGEVYEQFLGKVIRLTKGGHAKLEEKPEVRKAGGVYYTPAYVVDYIVEQTIGRLLERKIPARAVTLRVLDPACGSGSFLIGAYQYLLDWHRDKFVADDPEKHARGRNPRLYRGAAGDWRLTTGERKRILLNSIYGVDVDSQAVEVTKLSLLLKVLEGESKETVNNQLRLFHQRALPDLGRNIKCGNSLVGPDFFEDRQINDGEECYRINAFDWKNEFPEILRGPNPGFDAVIGNPPYGASANEVETAYYRKYYGPSTGSLDSFALFIERASRLLRSAGRFGMILQSAFVSSPSMAQMRRTFLNHFRPMAFATMPYDVFQAYVDTVIAIAERLTSGKTLADCKDRRVTLTVFPPRYSVLSVADFSLFAKTADALQWQQSSEAEFLVTLSQEEAAIIQRLRVVESKFSDILDIQRGVTPFEPKSRKLAGKNAARAFTGVVRRYMLTEGKPAFVTYDSSLAEFKPPRYFRGPRVLLRELISRQFRLQAAYTDEDYVTNKSMQSLLVSQPSYHPFYVLGLLNSRLLSWYFLAIHSVGRRDDFPKIVLKQTRELPFVKINFTKKSQRETHDRLVQLVGTMLSLQGRRLDAKTEHAQAVSLRQIEMTDRQIDQLVYRLYGLTNDQIQIVEQARNV
ncbi:MAG: N-6 DNA methylase [Pirellulales bacterium]